MRNIAPHVLYITFILLIAFSYSEVSESETLERNTIEYKSAVSKAQPEKTTKKPYPTN